MNDWITGITLAMVWAMPLWYGNLYVMRPAVVYDDVNQRWRSARGMGSDPRRTHRKEVSTRR